MTMRIEDIDPNFKVDTSIDREGIKFYNVEAEPFRIHGVYREGGNFVRMPQAIASLQEVIDRVFVVCQDLEGNCYEMFVFDVPVDLFVNAGGRG